MCNKNQNPVISLDDPRAKRGRFLYILEAAFEYFITLTITGAILAKVTQFLGFSDALTGILSAFASLGCTFQLVALFLANKKPVKRWVTAGHIINQTAFAMVFAVPLLPIPAQLRNILFAGFLIVGYIIHSIIVSPKINWFMGLVKEEKKGVFTSIKESVSLVGGMIFSFVMGYLIDRYEENGEIRNAYILLAVTCFSLMILHALTLIFTVERDDDDEPLAIERPGFSLLKQLLSDKRVFAVISIDCLWAITIGICTPFYGAYQVGPLGFSLVETSIFNVVHCLLRALLGPLLGRFADRHSFPELLRLSYLIAALSFAVMAFAVPSNGRIIYLVYVVLYAIPAGGTSISGINLIYSSVAPHRRMSAYALDRAVTGVIGFLATLLAGLVVDRIQANGNLFLGIGAYAQQILSAFSAVMCILTFLFNLFILERLLAGKKAN